jgi:RNA polymerase sigma-70 factor, ECF subfamily
MWFWIFGTDEEQSDEALMKRFQEGDSNALGTLYDRYADRLKAFAYRSGAKRPDDVVQDAFMRVVRKGDTFKGSAKFKTWLFSIVRNLCIDASRRDKFREIPKLEDPVGREGGMTRGDTIANPKSADGLRATQDSEFRAAFEESFARLPKEQREVFMLRQHSAMAFAEIGQTVGCNENTAKSRMRYALKALREDLREHF